MDNEVELLKNSVNSRSQPLALHFMMNSQSGSLRSSQSLERSTFSNAALKKLCGVGDDLSRDCLSVSVQVDPVDVYLSHPYYSKTEMLSLGLFSTRRVRIGEAER